MLVLHEKGSRPQPSQKHSSNQGKIILVLWVWDYGNKVQMTKNSKRKTKTINSKSILTVFSLATPDNFIPPLVKKPQFVFLYIFKFYSLLPNSWPPKCNKPAAWKLFSSCQLFPGIPQAHVIPPELNIDYWAPAKIQQAKSHRQIPVRRCMFSLKVQFIHP